MYCNEKILGSQKNSLFTSFRYHLFVFCSFSYTYPTIRPLTDSPVQISVLLVVQPPIYQRLSCGSPTIHEVIDPRFQAK
jgi:hypothetical protein